MVVRLRRRLSPTEVRDLWRRWRLGETQTQISLALGVRPSKIFDVIQARGGFSPAERVRRATFLSASEREDISRGLIAGLSLRALARQLGRSASTVSREVARNGGRVHYRATQAEQRALAQARRPKPCALATDSRLRRIVSGKLAKNWSPQQISGWLKTRAAGNVGMSVSHETIYKSLFIQARGVLKRELLAHLRSHRLSRKAKTSKACAPAGGIRDAVSLRERPAEAQDRAVPGHWEGDLLSGSGNSHIATLVERQTRFLMLVRIETKDSKGLADALAQKIKALPRHMKASLAWDRGTEMTSHARFTMASKVQVYFCDPYSPWQRGSNENTNGLLRQYFPKGSDLSRFSQAALDKVAHEMNTRPRKTLGYKTPAAMFAQAVALTG